MTVHSIEKSRSSLRSYEHARNNRVRRVLRFLLRYIGFTLLAKVNRVEGQENIPESGPAILMINHIAFIDSIVVLHVTKRDIVPMAKIEVYDYPVIGIFPHLWGVIPVRREEVDRRAIQQSLEVLRAGELVLVAPEGTRGPALKQGKEGIAYLASSQRSAHHPGRHRWHDRLPGFEIHRSMARARSLRAVRASIPFPSGIPETPGATSYA